MVVILETPLHFCSRLFMANENVNGNSLQHVDYVLEKERGDNGSTTRLVIF